MRDAADLVQAFEGDAGRLSGLDVVDAAGRAGGHQLAAFQRPAPRGDDVLDPGLLAERRERGLPAGDMKNVAAANLVKVMPRNQQPTAVPPAEIPLQSQKGKCHDDN